ncbi:hypothetical protein HGM15179_020402 [Zosterops borbonicus]|uniref:Uncharacterized protein n=1 Tax=Zosterops borbonicus TaxID=364589 RepID=A0A8K1D6E4_9PASS|nr:hypothetical protein HGM15179_020402 [Zosterops borbonicus]
MGCGGWRGPDGACIAGRGLRDEQRKGKVGNYKPQKPLRQERNKWDGVQVIRMAPGGTNGEYKTQVNSCNECESHVRQGSSDSFKNGEESTQK